MDVNDRLTTQVERLETVATEGAGGAAADVDATTASESLDIRDYTSVEQYLKAAVARLVPAGNEGRDLALAEHQLQRAADILD